MLPITPREVQPKQPEFLQKINTLRQLGEAMGVKPTLEHYFRALGVDTKGDEIAALIDLQKKNNVEVTPDMLKKMIGTYIPPSEGAELVTDDAGNLKLVNKGTGAVRPVVGAKGKSKEAKGGPGGEGGGYGAGVGRVADDIRSYYKDEISAAAQRHGVGFNQYGQIIANRNNPDAYKNFQAEVANIQKMRDADLARAVKGQPPHFYGQESGFVQPGYYMKGGKKIYIRSKWQWRQTFGKRR